MCQLSWFDCRFAFRFSLFPSCPSSPFQLVSIWLEPDTLVLFSSSFLPSWVRVTVSIERRCRYVHALRARFLIVRKKEGTGEIRDPVHFARIEDNRAETRNWEACLWPIGRDSLENVANRWVEDVKLLLFLFFFFFCIRLCETDEIKLRNEGGDIIFSGFLRNNYCNE